MLREWLWRGGGLRIAVTQGVLFGICMGAAFYWLTGSHSAVAATAVGVLAGAGFGTLMGLTPWGGGWLRIRQVSELAPSERVMVLRAVLRGESVFDPRLAPGVLACAEMVMTSVRKQQARPRRWAFFAFAALDLVAAVAKTITGQVWQAVLLWAGTAMFLGFAWAAPRALEPQRERAKAAADSAADQIGRSSVD